MQIEKCEIYTRNNHKEKIPFIFLNSDRKEGKILFEEIASLTQKDFVLIAIPVNDWNDDLSPWYCKPVFKGTKPFAGKADEHLSYIETKILPSVEEALLKMDIRSSYHALAGYSLAGLFALYAAFTSDRFKKIVSASGSLWYPDFHEFTRSHPLSRQVDQIYLSLGDQESHTKNKLMAAVEDKTRTIASELNETCHVFFEMNEGNHFKDPEFRTAKGIAYILNN